jgi:hypothetical protein
VNQQLPVAAGSPDNYLIAWQDDRFANIYAARVDTAGTLLDPTGFPLTTANHEQQAPNMIFDGSKYFAVWHDRRNVSGTGIYGTRIATSGTVLNPAGIEISYLSGENERFPALANNNGRFVIAWNRDPNILAAAVTDTSGTVFDTMIISSTIASDARPCVASDGASFLVGWEDIRNAESDIYVTRLDSSGAILDSSGIPLCVVSGDQRHPIVAWDGTYFSVVWEDYRSTLSDIFGARVSTDGSVFNRFPVVTQEGGQFTPAITSGAGAQLLLVYAGFADSLGNQLINTTRIWGSCFNPPASITEEKPGSNRNSMLLHLVTNPAHAKAQLWYSIPRGDKVLLTVYDASGRRIRTLACEYQTAGRYGITWDGLDDYGESVKSGIYFLCLRVGSERCTRKVAFFH